MKTKSYIYALLAVGMACATTACDENAWNEENFPNFKEDIVDKPTTDVQTIEMTLADADYATIAGLAANKTLAGDEGKNALAAVGTLKRFSSEAPASKYVPAYLESSNFPYFTLTDGSAVKLTYRVAQDEPAEFVAAQDFQKFTVTSEMYREEVWGSEDYVDAFAPSQPAAQYLPALLADYADLEKGGYCLVTYNQALQEPVFGGGGEQPIVPQEIFAETFTESLGDFTINDIKKPDNLAYVWSYGGANYGAKASAYFEGTSYASESRLISPVIDLAGFETATLTFEHVCNKFPDLDFAKASCRLMVSVENQSSIKEVVIPTYSDNKSWTFVPSGDIDLSGYAGKKIQLMFSYTSEDGKSGTWEVKNLALWGMPAARSAAARSAVYVPTEVVNTVYYLNKGTWAPAKNFVALSPADYTAMGQSYANLTKAEPYLSIYLANIFPYAAEGDIKYVYWTHYASSSSTIKCSAYIFDGSAWKPNDFVVEETSQFVRNSGKWIFDPNVTITLPAGKGQELSTLYFQACVDWVFENICKPLGSTDIKSGAFYVTSYGNNEYYSGTSAYQGNVDLRASAARAQYAAGYEGMTDEEVVALEKKRFMEEVMPGALGKLHADAQPIEGLEVLYTINFSVYTGATTEYTAVFRLVAPGKFEPVSCTWDK